MPHLHNLLQRDERLIDGRPFQMCVNRTIILSKGCEKLSGMGIPNPNNAPAGCKLISVR